MKDTELCEISRKLTPLISGCYFELLNATAQHNGEISDIAAVAILSSVPGMNEVAARKAILELEEASLISRCGKVLTLAAFGKTIVPDFDDWR